MAHIPAAERRKQLVAAAIDVIADIGLAKATTRMITARADVPLAVMHYCFRSKDELLNSVADEIIERTHPWIERVEVDNGLEGAIRSVTTELWSWLHREQNVQLALMEMLIWKVHAQPGTARRVDVYGPTVELLCEPLASAAAARSQTSEVPLSEVVRVVVAGVDGLFMQYLATGDLGAVEIAVAQLGEAAIHLAGIDPPTG